MVLQLQIIELNIALLLKWRFSDENSVNNMAGGDMGLGCTARRKSKKNSDYSLSENGEGSKNGPPRTTRGGLRVYKIVILGDGGVGKSGGWFLFCNRQHFFFCLFLCLLIDKPFGETKKFFICFEWKINLHKVCRCWSTEVLRLLSFVRPSIDSFILIWKPN